MSRGDAEQPLPMAAPTKSNANAPQASADGKYHCEKCFQSFHQPMALTAHMRVHATRKPVKRTKGETPTTAGEAEGSVEESYTCPGCRKLYRYYKALISHQSKCAKYREWQKNDTRQRQLQLQAAADEIAVAKAQAGSGADSAHSPETRTIPFGSSPIVNDLSAALPAPATQMQATDYPLAKQDAPGPTSGSRMNADGGKSTAIPVQRPDPPATVHLPKNASAPGTQARDPMLLPPHASAVHSDLPQAATTASKPAPQPDKAEDGRIRERALDLLYRAHRPAGASLAGAVMDAPRFTVPVARANTDEPLVRSAEQTKTQIQKADAPLTFATQVTQPEGPLQSQPAPPVSVQQPRRQATSFVQSAPAVAIKEPPARPAVVQSKPAVGRTVVPATRRPNKAYQQDVERVLRMLDESAMTSITELVYFNAASAKDDPDANIIHSKIDAYLKANCVEMASGETIAA